MQIQLGSKHLTADVAVALDVAGREHLVVVAKATWSIPELGQRPRPLKPRPLVMADEFYGEPGESALRAGSDFARIKSQCDVIFDACAHARSNTPIKQMDVEVQVGAMRKRVRVHGPRRWYRAMGMTMLSPPEPFVQVPLHYGFAYGGTRWFVKRSERMCASHLPNPVGLGFADANTIDQIDSQLAPCLEDLKTPVKDPSGAYAPVALSAIARHWSPRRELAGTYDEKWRQDQFPLLPADFDEAFHQVAPPDQRIDYPRGGESITLSGLLPSVATVNFALPPLTLHAHIVRVDDSTCSEAMRVDTLMFETEEGMFSAVWRASLPIRRRIQEFRLVTVTPLNEQMWLAQLAKGACTGCGGAPSFNQQSSI
jgi:hypothetical protein